MTINKRPKKKATKQVRLYPTTHQRLRIRAAQEGVSIAELIDRLTQ